jgi:hypothetical protein
MRSCRIRSPKLARGLVPRNVGVRVCGCEVDCGMTIPKVNYREDFSLHNPT